MKKGYFGGTTGLSRAGEKGADDLPAPDGHGGKFGVHGSHPTLVPCLNERVNNPADDAQRNINSLSAAFFRCVSFAAGDRPDYAGIRALFVPAGMLFKGVAAGVVATSVDEFIAARQKSFDDATLTELIAPNGSRGDKTTVTILRTKTGISIPAWKRDYLRCQDTGD